MMLHYSCYGANKTWDVQIHSQALFKGVVIKQARFIQWPTGTTQARQRVILGQAWVDDRRTISNRARQRVNPGNTGRYQNTGEQARQDLEGLRRVAIARIYAIQYSAERKRKSMVYVECVISAISCVSVQWMMGIVVWGGVQQLV